jgi:peptide/nickel transport system ATP-binding protein
MGALLEIKDLRIHYNTDAGVVKALNGVSLSLDKGVTLGLVGETGAGKTTLAKGVMRLIRTPPGEIVSGEVIYDGKNLLKLSEHDMRSIRAKTSPMIFQDPMTSLNPVMTVGDQIAETIETHENISKAAAMEKAVSMLELVGIDGGADKRLSASVFRRNEAAGWSSL